jgi:threonine dehydratase
VKPHQPSATQSASPMASAPGSLLDPISLEEFREAAEHSKSVIIETPMLHSRWLTDAIKVPVYLKCECMQRAGSFKVRGAYNFISRLNEQERAAGVCAASAGNHAQGVALSAQMLGIHATIFMPENAPLPKVRATEGYGAEVRLAGQNVGDCLALARQFSAATGAVFVHPFDDRKVIIGQGTLALDIVRQCPDVATVVVCTGGGGLLSGIAMAIKQLKVHVCSRAHTRLNLTLFPAARSSHRRPSRARRCVSAIPCRRKTRATARDELHRGRRQCRHSWSTYIRRNQPK